MTDVLTTPVEPEIAPEPAAAVAQPAKATHVLRFDRIDRTLHGFLMLSFLGLAATGMPVLFSTAPWAGRMARLLGGFSAIHRLHRVFATIMILVFIVHVGRLLARVVLRKDYSVFWGPTSMTPQPKDVADMYQHFRWFVGQGPRPQFDRYTYWEKFDYWAVFWGMAIIGGSGLLLWFPVAFSRLVPGWAFNIALLIHGEEALLAVGFIFTIHFFNSHLRPEKFPMDMVIFTGRVPAHEWQDERPLEYARLAAVAPDAGPPSDRAWMVGRVIGSAAVAAGLLLVALIAYALLTDL
jgi:cytochrome b subunit of formate dehydrogenase